MSILDKNGLNFIDSQVFRSINFHDLNSCLLAAWCNLPSVAYRICLRLSLLIYIKKSTYPYNNEASRDGFNKQPRIIVANIQWDVAEVVLILFQGFT